MKTNYPIRDSVRIILLNDANEVLLMCIDDPKIISIGGQYKGHFWTLLGGGIKEHETVQKAATRELFEEIGINEKNFELGPIVWFGELDLILHGKPTHIREKYIVARTKRKNVSLTNLTQDEAKVVKHLKWFSLNQIINSRETIYPILLPKYLPDIIAGKYPKEPFEIKLNIKAKK